MCGPQYKDVRPDGKGNVEVLGEDERERLLPDGPAIADSGPAAPLSQAASAFS